MLWKPHFIMKLGQNVCLDEISDSSKMGRVGSKTGSLGEMLEKPCARSRGHIFSLLIMKTRSLGQILQKPCVPSRDFILV